MFEFIVLILILVVFWLNKKLSQLQKSIKYLEKRLPKEIIDTASLKEDIIYTGSPPPPEEKLEEKPKDIQKEKKEHIWSNPEKQKSINYTARKTISPSKSASIFNENFISKLPIWIGGIACFLAAFYFIKYSIDNNLIGPWGQCIIAMLFGLSLLKVADKVRLNTSFHHHILLGQSITGAGLMILYAVSYAATHYYNLIPIIAGFAAMTCVTGMAIMLALRHGVPIALMAIIAAFITPALFSNNTGSAPALFSYIFVLFSGFMFLCYKQGWKLLSYVTVAFSFLWIFAWMERSANPFDSTIISLFLIAISASIVTIEHKILKSKMSDYKKFLLTPSMLVIILSLIVFAFDFLANSTLSYNNLFLYGLLTLATMLLAYFAPQQYAYYPFASLSLIFCLFLLRVIKDTEHYLTFLLFAFTAIFVSGFLWNKIRKDLWAKILTYAASGFFTIYIFNHWQSSWLEAQDILPYQSFIIGAFLCSLLIHTAKQALIVHNINAISYFAGGATFILSLASAYTLPGFTILGALSCQILALIWINSYIPIKDLKTYIYGLLSIIIIPLCILVTIEIAGKFNISVKDFTAIISITIPIFIAPFLLPNNGFTTMKSKLEKTSLSLITITILALFLALLNSFGIHSVGDVLSLFNIRTTLLNILYILSLSFCYLGFYTQCENYKNYGVTLFYSTIIAHICADYVFFNPFIINQSIAGTAIVNMLFMAYMMPFLYGYILWKKILSASETSKFFNIDTLYLYLIPVSAVLFWLSSNIRFIYAGHDQMHDTSFENIEIYTYSAIWLLYAAALMLIGIFKNINDLRKISLGLMLVITAKVFLYDASELTGLWRVASFLGLGISLIGISWLYGFTTKRLIQDK